jgi:nitroreductase
MQMQKKSQGGFLGIVKNRKTTYEFSDRPVSARSTEKILECGRWAPSHQNTQPWRFIVVKNKEVISRLMEICIYGDFHTDPSLIIAVVHNPITSYHDKTLNHELDLVMEMHKYLNIGMPLITMAYAASQLGVDSCIISPAPLKARSILDIEVTDYPVMLLGPGYENKGARKKERTRKDLGTIVSYIK